MEKLNQSKFARFEQNQINDLSKIVGASATGAGAKGNNDGLYMCCNSDSYDSRTNTITARYMYLTLDQYCAWRSGNMA